MRIYKRFWLGRNAAPRSLYTAVLALAPERMAGGDLRVEARTGERANLWKIALLVTLSRAFGLRRTVGGGPGSYGYEVVRNYEESDFAACELLFLGGDREKHQIQHDRDPESRLLLNPEFIRDLRLGNAGRRVVVAKTVRKLLEDANLIGLQFQEAVPRGSTSTKVPGLFWELQSSIVLPKMANTHQMKYIGMRGAPHTPFDGDYSRMVFIDDPPYRSGEIHYRRSDLALLGEFDIAQTFELYRQPHRELVVSQRFYQVCLKHDIKLRLEPVRTDPK